MIPQTPSGMTTPPAATPDLHMPVTPHKTNLQPVREMTPSLEFRTIHGYRRAFRIAGSGPAILLIHGIGDNSLTWSSVHSTLAQRFTTIAPDLLGHGQSDKPRADYSVAAYANGMRDLLNVLGIDKVTIIGHSLGGGVAMQFAYQFPDMIQRLILVGSGGISRELNPLLRLASLPLSATALAALRLPAVLPALHTAGRVVRATLGSTGIARDFHNMVRILAHLPDPEAAAAFTQTLRCVVDWRGQLVTMLDRCYLTESIPVQLIWGSQDTVIPASQAHEAHTAIPGSYLEIFDGCGHFPFHDEPERFAGVVEQFIDSTTPAHYDRDTFHRLLATHSPAENTAHRDTHSADDRYACTSDSPDIVESEDGYRCDCSTGIHRF